MRQLILIIAMSLLMSGKAGAEDGEAHIEFFTNIISSIYEKDYKSASEALFSGMPTENEERNTEMAKGLKNNMAMNSMVYGEPDKIFKIAYLGEFSKGEELMDGRQAIFFTVKHVRGEVFWSFVFEKTNNNKYRPYALRTGEDAKKYFDTIK